MMRGVKVTHTVAEHQRIAAALYDAKESLLRVTEAGPLSAKAHHAARGLTRAFRALSETRDAMDDMFCEEYPEDYTSNVYYPGSSRKR
jgi:hypothetical protein